MSDKPKSLREYFELAKDRGFPHAEEALAECVAQDGADQCDGDTGATSCADALSRAFVWWMSDQGLDFWEGVYREWCAMEGEPCHIDSDL